MLDYNLQGTEDRRRSGDLENKRGLRLFSTPRIRSYLNALAIIWWVGLLYPLWGYAAPPVYPLKISTNSRFFVDQTNAPFFINGDTPWSLISQVSKEDADLYLQDCANKGVNSLIVNLIERYYADNAPANFYLIPPFTTVNKLTTPNEAFFEHADWIINKAAEYNIQIILAPLYLGCCNDGWAQALSNNNTEADARWFGEWIGNRYKNFPNLVYVWGNDLNPGDLQAKIRAMAEGALAKDPNHLHTYHAIPETSSLDAWPAGESWLTVNATYTYNPAVQVKCLQDYNRAPVVPYFLFESQYENEQRSLPIQQRKQAYVAVLSGAAGHHYGNNPIWHMNGMPGDNSLTWKDHLNDPARAALPLVKALVESRAWYELIPDQNHSVVTAGYGSGDHYVAAARTLNGATVIAYLPGRDTITVNMSRISGGSVQAWWYNPRDGSAQTIGLFPASGSRVFSSPDGQDWVLVLDDATKGFPPPGTHGVKPAVTITAPVFGSMFSAPASLTIEALANDSDGSITKVGFYANGTLLGTDTTAPYSYSWGNVQAGSYSLSAVATDNSGLTATSSVVNITVINGNPDPNNQPPSVSINAPNPGDVFQAPAPIPIEASAIDNDGTITKVDFYANGTLLATVTALPYRWEWNGALAGDYSLYAVATDNQGATTMSSAVMIKVNQPPTVGLTTPVNGATYLASAAIILSATVSDGDGSVTQVAFFDGNTLLGAATTSPYRFTWNGASPGSHTLTAVATDNQGGTTTSNPVVVTVTSGLAVKINFQPSNAQVPAGYLIDSGQVYGNRGNGFSYGWNAANNWTADRNSSRSPDQRYDTLIYSQVFRTNYTWEIGVPIGTYNVHLVSGDPNSTGSTYRSNVEGVLTVNGRSTRSTRWFEGSVTVTVTDGKLTVSNASGASGNKLCYIDIQSQ